MVTIQNTLTRSDSFSSASSGTSSVISGGIYY